MPRARLKLAFSGIATDIARVPALDEMLTRVVTVDLFKPADIVVAWPEDVLTAEQREILSQLVQHLGFLGRSESWCDGRLLEEQEAQSLCRLARENVVRRSASQVTTRSVVPHWCEPLGERPVTDDEEVVRVLCANPQTAFLDEQFPRPKTVKSARGKNKQTSTTRHAHYEPNWQERYASPYYDTLKDIHAAWLLTACPALNGQVPRDVLLAEHPRLMMDEQERCHQWSWTESCPRGLDRSSQAFESSGFGTHELVKYYELVRELLWSCWERLEECGSTLRVESALRTTPARDQHLRDQPSRRGASSHSDLATLGDFLTEEVPRLERLREEWLDTPDPELHFRTPRSIIDRERQRLPEAVSGREAMHDPDCPCCQMLADMPGPTFWHLDGCNMDNEFAFDIYRVTREEWDAEQREWAELDRKFDARWAERKRLGLPNSMPIAESDSTTQEANGAVWSSSYSKDGANVPLGIRLFGLGGHLAELISDLRDAGEYQSLIDALNRDFGNLREVLDQTASGEFSEELLEPVLAKFSETLTSVAADHSTLQAKCDDLISQLAKFLAPDRAEDGLGLGGGPWPSCEDEPDLGDVPF